LYLTVFGALAAPVGMLIGGKPQWKNRFF
jgi:hypothetical protein